MFLPEDLFVLVFSEFFVELLRTFLEFAPEFEASSPEPEDPPCWPLSEDSDVLLRLVSFELEGMSAKVSNGFSGSTYSSGVSLPGLFRLCRLVVVVVVLVVPGTLTSVLLSSRTRARIMSSSYAASLEFIVDLRLVEWWRSEGESSPWTGR